MIDPRREAFNAASLKLAISEGYPVLLPSGRFVADARCAWLIEALENHLEHSEIRRYRPGWFSASALGKTDAELIAAYHGETPIGGGHDASTLRIFSVGNDRDATYKRWLRECGLSAIGDDHDRQISIPYLRLMGSCDDVLRHPDGGFVVFEMKTINPFQFSRLEAPQEAHVWQVHAYMAGLALREAVILYENKSDQALRAFWVPFDGELWDGIATRLRRLRVEADAAND